MHLSLDDAEPGASPLKMVVARNDIFLKGLAINITQVRCTKVSVRTMVT